MKKAILIVSFGTTYTETRIKNITAIKNQVSMFYPDTIIEEAVSSRIVRNHMKQDEHIDAKSPLEALMSLKAVSYTHLINIINQFPDSKYIIGNLWFRVITFNDEFITDTS